MRPARKASRPASTAFLIACAISTGFCALATAVFMSTASQPSSMAMAASDAVPTPASTTTGTLALPMMSSRFQGLRIPIPEPISRRARYARPAMRSGSAICSASRVGAFIALASADRDDDLQRVAVGKSRRGVAAARHDLAVLFDGHAFPGELERVEELRDIR